MVCLPIYPVFMVLKSFFWSSIHKNQILKVAEATKIIGQAKRTINFIRHCLNTPNSKLALDSPRSLDARVERKSAVTQRSKTVADDFIESGDHNASADVHYSKPLSVTAQMIIFKLNKWKQGRYIRQLRRFKTARWLNRQLLNLLRH